MDHVGFDLIKKKSIYCHIEWFGYPTHSI